jgi:hypothetical protein
VTIEVPGGGGVTVGGSMTSLGASATSVCSSLSSEACSDLQATSCDDFGDNAGVSNMLTPVGFALVCMTCILAIIQHAGP